MSEASRYVLCSDCFQNVGLSLEASKVASLEASSGRCPNCGSTDGHLLDSRELELLLSSFFRHGSRLLGSGTTEPIYTVVPRDPDLAPVPFDLTLQGDYDLIQSHCERTVRLHAPRLVLLGITETSEDIEASLGDLNEPARLNYGLRSAFDKIVSACHIRTVPHGARLYRIRKNAGHPLDQSSYDTPPSGIRQDARFSCDGFPVFYAAFDIETSIHECAVSLADEVSLATLHCERKLELLDFLDLRPDDEFLPDVGHYLDSLFTGRSERDYRICQLLARRLMEHQVDGFIYPSYYSPVLGRARGNVAIFGYPLQEGDLTVRSLNRIRLDSVKYEYTFGPVQVSGPDEDLMPRNTITVHDEFMRGARCDQLDTDRYDSALAQAREQDNRDYLDRVRTIFDREFSLPPCGPSVPARVVVRASPVDGNCHKYSFLLSLPGGEEKLFYEMHDTEEGRPISLTVRDFDGDGRPEIAVIYLCGAHSRGLGLFRITEEGRVERVPGTDLIGSDASSIEFGDFDHDGMIEVVTRNRHWENQELGEVETRYKYDGNRYVQVDEWRRGHGTGVSAPLSSPNAAQRAQLLWTNTDVGIGTWKSRTVICNDLLCVPVAGRCWNRPDDHDGLVCIERATGDIKWRIRCGSDANAATMLGSHIYFGTDLGMVHSVNVDSGTEDWQSPLDEAVLAAPLPMSGSLLIATANGSLVQLDRETGAIRGRIRLPSGVVADPLERDGKVYVATVTGCLYRFNASIVFPDNRESLITDVVPSDEIECVSLGEYMESGIGFHASPVFWNHLIVLPYVRDTYDSGMPLAAFRVDGLQLEWLEAKGQNDDSTVGNIRARPTICRDMLVVPAAYGNLVGGVTMSGRLKWSCRCGVPFFPQWGSPVSSDDFIMVPRFDGYIHAINPIQGTRAWSMYLGDEYKAGEFFDSDDEISHAEQDCLWKNYRSAPLNSPLVLAEQTVYGLNASGMAFAVRLRPRGDTTPDQTGTYPSVCGAKQDAQAP